MFNTRLAPFVWFLLITLLLVVAGLGLMEGGVYGLTLFALLPVAVGAAWAWIRHPVTALTAAGTGAAGVFAVLCGLLLLEKEGLICLAMATPLAVPLGALGGWLVFRSRKREQAAVRLAMLLFLPPATLVWDLRTEPDIFPVTTTVEVHARPEDVWKHVVAFPSLPPPTEWIFRTGLAYPMRARIEGNGAGAVRYCEFSTGSFVEPITTWNEPELLQFGVTESPPPMVEWTPYGTLAARHLHGYFSAVRGEFRMIRLPGDRTRLEGTTWYRHGLLPAGYWRLWSDFILHKVHYRVLRHIRDLAEADAIRR